VAGSALGILSFDNLCSLEQWPVEMMVVFSFDIR
jgi:hypothetical protein